MTILRSTGGQAASCRSFSDYGSIVASTNNGLVLLTTQPVSNLRPLAGPIKITGKLRAPAALTFTAFNGASGYQFLLSATKSPDGTGRVGVRIWHRDPRSGADVVAYDNMRNGLGADAAGSIVEDGADSAEAD